MFFGFIGDGYEILTAETSTKQDATKALYMVPQNLDSNPML